MLCLLAYGDTALKPWFNKHSGHTRRGVTMTLFMLLFPASGYLGPPNTTKQWKTQNDKSTHPALLPPPHARGLKADGSPVSLSVTCGNHSDTFLVRRFWSLFPFFASPICGKVINVYVFCFWWFFRSPRLAVWSLGVCLADLLIPDPCLRLQLYTCWATSFQARSISLIIPV